MKFRKILIFVVFFTILLNQVFTNLKFTEILPNTDDDANLEYIEIHNSWEIVLSLSGYVLKDKSDKEFIFNDTYFLGPLEKKKYYRTETKILLNDTDEQLYLYDNFWNLIDTYSYTNSENWKVLIIVQNNLDNNNWVQEENNTDDPLSETWSLDDETSTWETDNQPESNSNESDSDTLTWELDLSSWSNEEYLLPEIKYVFQSPSYLLEKDEKISVYNCDTSKEECKINLDYSNSFTWSFKLSDYICETIFWFETWEENKCNPWTIVVPIWTYDINIKIKNKNNLNQFSELIFKVINKWYIKPITTNSYVYVNNIYNDNLSIDIEKPQIIVQSWLDENNQCINTKSCKVNFMYQTKNSKERCIWDFWWWIYSDWLENKCNPWYVSYSNWNFIVKLKVFEDWNISNYQFNDLSFSNVILESKDKKVEQEEKYIKNNDLSSKSIDNMKGIDIWNIKIHKIMPNPSSNNDEFIEIINNWNQDFDLSNCYIDDIIDWWSKKYNFNSSEIIKPSEIKSYTKKQSKINLNNNWDDVNLFCNDVLVDKLSWNFKVKQWYYLDHSRLDIYSGEAKVLEVIDWDTLKVQFLTSKKVENLRLIWIDTPETKNPNTVVQNYWEEAFEFVKDTINWEDIVVEMDPNNFRDSYSRLLWFVYYEWESLNKKLIQEWYARAYTNYDFKYKDEYIKAETVAKKNKLWVWASNNDTVKKVESKSIVAIKWKNLLAVIDVQWKLSSKKILTWNTITCFDTCSINFDWSNSAWSIKKYSWDFWNWAKHDWKNPWSINYNKFWNYKVYLAVSSDNWEINTSTFLVNYYKSPQKDKSTKKVTKVETKWNIKQNNDNYKNIEQQEFSTQNESKMIYYYIFLVIFVLWLIVVLLKKEKML